MAEQTVLVTGGGGYVAGWRIVTLLERGYRVRTTVRSTGREQAGRAGATRRGERRPPRQHSTPASSRTNPGTYRPMSRPPSEPLLLGALAKNELAFERWWEIGPDGRATFLAYIDRARTRRGQGNRVELVVLALAHDPYSRLPVPDVGGGGDGG
jgi:hypothetical protein